MYTLLLLSTLLSSLDLPAQEALLRRIDGRMKSTGDYQALAYIESRAPDKEDLVYEARIYRRDRDDKFMMLFLAPKAEAGKGYLKIQRNLWMYDPGVGRWERRTEREGLGGSEARMSDFKPLHLIRDFDHRYLGLKKLGRFQVHHFALMVHEEVKLPHPKVEIWIDAESENVLKIQEMALSGRLMRTLYYPRWEKIFSASKGAFLYYPREIRIYDEIEKGKRSTALLKEVDLKPLSANLFTKAWLESKSR